MKYNIGEKLIFKFLIVVACFLIDSLSSGVRCLANQQLLTRKHCLYHSGLRMRNFT